MLKLTSSVHINMLICKMYAMKKGVVLLITIGFITVLSAIIAYMFSLSNSAFDEAQKSEQFNQSSILFYDVKDILDSYAKDVNDSEDLRTFLMGTPPFYDDKSALSLDVELEPLSNKININSILIKNKIDKNIVKFLQNVCETYNIIDSNFFIDLVLDTIDSDSVSREAMSEISQENMKFSNGRVLNFEHFKAILEYYVKKVQDRNILKVPWRELIYFGKSEYSEVDCDRMSRELINVIGFNSEDFAGCSELKDAVSEKIGSKFHLKSFSKVKNYYILVKISYQTNSIQDQIEFKYNIKNSKVSDSELF